MRIWGRRHGLPRPACVKCLSSFVPRKTFVSRPKVGNPMGAEPPWSSGRDSQGNRLEIGSLGRFLSPLSLAAKKGARRRRRYRGTNRRGERRIRGDPEDCPLRRGREQDESVSPAGDPISQRGEMGERRAGGPCRSTRRSLRFRRTVILRKLRIARWLLLFKSKHIVSI